MMVGGVEKMSNEKKGMRKEYKWPACRGLSDSAVSVCWCAGGCALNFGFSYLKKKKRGFVVTSSSSSVVVLSGNKKLGREIWW